MCLLEVVYLHKLYKILVNKQNQMLFLLFLIQEQIKIKLGDKRFEACQLFLVLL